jgi:dienelactone hydrolase
LVVFHQHAGRYGLGKSEPAGLAGDPMHHTGARLAEQGFVVLCADALCFEERQRGHPALPAALEPNGDGGEYERIEFLRYVVDGKSMAWKNILDIRRAVDYLVSRPEVAADRMGCYGHSMGSTHVWLSPDKRGWCCHHASTRPALL